ncbi:MAG: bacillithiol system redox-active protein YtxJ [Candidatus Hydrogenedentes bacterium]|nr:bacillithiol system redox-active protein YtxJ [Candidatus Hydrogenedentota bacterium]
MIEINDLDELKKIIENSQNNTILIFKHSTRCPVSSHAKKELEKFLEKYPQFSSKAYLIKVIECRQLSNYISEITNVEHQSPQILILKDGKVTSHLSHFKITAKSIEASI